MTLPILNKKDFQSDNEVRWCPGCGDYAILATVQKTLADLGYNRDETVFVSGIGCAARFPYYMNTYGMHTIHGRAPAFATGVKLANPDLKVFLVTGDGDGLSIGANHLLHLFRRNVDITVLLFNNQIYGLTKGQYSPTSQQGHKAKSTPFGSLEQPLNPLLFALSADASFVARSIDNDAQHLGDVLKAAVAHKGTSFVEILQNCVVFNDGAFDHVRDKSVRDRETVFLQEGAKIVFDQGSKGIALDVDTLTPRVTSADDPHVLTHEPAREGLKSSLLALLAHPEFPTPMGIFKRVERACFEDEKQRQDREITAAAKSADVRSLLVGTNAWEI